MFFKSKLFTFYTCIKYSTLFKFGSKLSISVRDKLDTYTAIKLRIRFEILVYKGSQISNKVYTNMGNLNKNLFRAIFLLLLFKTACLKKKGMHLIKKKKKKYS